MKINFDELQQDIMIRLWKCNEMSGKQAEDYSHIAIDELKKHLEQAKTREYFFVQQPKGDSI